MSLVVGFALGWPAIAAAGGEPTGRETTSPDQCRLVIEGQLVERLVVAAPDGRTRTSPKPGGEVLLPAGCYRVQEAELEGGYLCQVYAARPGDSVSLSPQQPGTMRVGAPLTPTLKVESQARTLSLSYELLDAAGHSYSPQDTSRPPQFTVTENGQTLGSGSFSYG